MKSPTRSQPAACSQCRQDILRACRVCMYPGDDGSCLYEPIGRLVLAGTQVGLDIDTMIEMLNDGMSITDLVTYIESCRAAN
jgi:hypothetical protein